MTTPERVYLEDTDYLLLQAAQDRLDQDRRYHEHMAAIHAQNAAAWEAHLAHPIVAAGAPVTPEPLDPEPADEPDTFGSLLVCIRELFVLAGTLLVRAVWPRRWVR